MTYHTARTRTVKRSKIKLIKSIYPIRGHIANIFITCSANVLQLEAAWRRARCSGLFWSNMYVTTSKTRMRTNWHFTASVRNSDIAIRFSDPNFRKESNNLAVSDVFTLWPWPLTPWPWTFMIHQMSRDETLCQIERNCTIRGWITAI